MDAPGGRPAALAADRVVCSTITLRHLPLAQALRTIGDLGFTAIDLGALPGVCDHVPADLDADGVRDVADTVRASGLAVVSVNADVGDLNVPLTPDAAARRRRHLEHLLDLCQAVGSRALVLPNGRQSHEPVTTLGADLDLVRAQLCAAGELARGRGVQLWVEAPHHFRLAFDLARSVALFDGLPDEIGAVCDVSHITASGATPRQFLQVLGSRTRHVHLRDAELGYIHHSIGRGQVDFSDTVAALADLGYTGALSLELETRDVDDDDRPAAARAAGEFISELVARTPTPSGPPLASAAAG